MHRLLDELLLRVVHSPSVAERHDSAVIEVGEQRVAFTTDGYVVNPLFFPGGDIGSLAVFGTVNDLAMAGARPLALSLGLILEEGLPIETVGRIAASVQRACDAVGVRVVTGDTKVVDRGKGDGVYVTTSGIGLVPAGIRVSPARIAAGDAVLVNGDLGRHGVAILATREHLAFETTILSDCSPLVEPVKALLDAGVDVHCMRDLTRGGLSSALNELARAANVTITLDELCVPVSSEVSAACEILGLDPLYVACEGRMAVFVPEAQAARAVEILRTSGACPNAARVGSVEDRGGSHVVMRTCLGGRRVVDMLSGEQLPRIC
jgi:hydrogenase expression/formation protein HypE